MRRKREDPVVAEVRCARSKIWREAGQTFEGLLGWLDEHVPVKRAHASKSRSHRAVHFACLDCRVAFKKPSIDLLGVAETVRLPCPNCRKPMQYMGRTFQAPRRNATRQWRKVALLIQAGFRFDSYSGGSMPKTLRTVPVFLKTSQSTKNRRKAPVKKRAGP